MKIINCIKQLINRCLYSEIINIEPIGIKPTIDITVSGNNLFYANSILTHNSGKSGGYATDDVDMDNTSESGGIPATADVMLAAYQMEGERDAGKINLKIIKNRLGGFIGQTIPFEVNYDTLKLFDWNSSNSLEEEEPINSKLNEDKELLDNSLDSL